MSDRLAIASAFSVLLMASYVLFGQEAARAPMGPDSISAPVSVSVDSDLPSLRDLLPLAR